MKSFKEILGGLDNFYLTKSEMDTVYNWSVQRISEYHQEAIELEGDDYIISEQVHAAIKYLFSRALFENKPFDKIAFNIYDDAEIHFEYKARKDIKDTNGKLALMQPETRYYLELIMKNFHIVGKTGRLGISSEEFLTMDEYMQYGYLIEYFKNSANKQPLLPAKVPCYYIVADFEEEVFYLSCNQMEYAFDKELAASTTHHFHDVFANSTAYDEVIRISFDEGLALACESGEVFRRYNENKNTHRPITVFEKLMQIKEVFIVDLVMFLNYIIIPNVLTRCNQIRKVPVSDKTPSNAPIVISNGVKFTTLERVLYNYRQPHTLTSQELRYLRDEARRIFAYTKESWNTRGHLRTYQDGKTVWVKPSVHKRRTDLLSKKLKSTNQTISYITSSKPKYNKE